MKLTLNIPVLIALTIAALLVPPASAQTLETGSIDVEIVNQQLTLVEDIALSFGTVQPFGRDGSVRCSPEGTTYNISTFSTDDCTPATWTVTGVPNAPFDIFLPSNSITVSNGSETMSITAFTRTGGNSQRYIGLAGSASFNVGATLNVSALQADGVYSGSYDVTVAYN